jgi:hypothetical protein
MSSNTATTLPYVKAVQPDNIPDSLKAIPQWIGWRAGPRKANGKFDKIPIDPRRGRKIDAHDPNNWLSFADAIAAHQAGKSDGVGIMMSVEHTVECGGELYYLVAFDFDRCRDRLNELKETRLQLGNPYVEVSPSGNGLRMFGLSKQLLKNGNNGNGVEVYFEKQFVTVTGVEGRGAVKDVTAGLVTLHQQWFSPQVTQQPQAAQTNRGPALPQGLKPNTAPTPPPETPDNIARLNELLGHVSSDTDYETWRDIIWSIMWTRWNCAEDIARDWSKLAARRYDDAGFDSVVHSFKPDGGITLGTLFHQAMLGGWIPPAKPQRSNVISIGAPGGRRLLTAAEIMAQPYQPYAVHRLLPAEGLASIYGETGSGKSFVALDLGFKIAAGATDWFGMKVTQAPVAYLALEGKAGLSKRIKAWQKHNKRQAPDPARFMVADFSIRETKGIERLGADIVATLGTGAVVVVDTLNQSAPGADENSSKDMSEVLANSKLLAEKVKGLVVLVHHAGKDKGRGMRGHSSLLAAMDAVIEVTSSPSGRSWSVAKAKDDEGGGSFDFRLAQYVVDVDQWGQDVTSCAVERTVNLAAPQPRRKPLSGKHQVPAIAKLKGMLATNPAGVSEADAIAAVSSILDCPAGRRSTVAKETIKRLAASGRLNVDEEGGTLTATENPTETDPL